MITTNQLAEATNLAQQTILNYVKEGIIEPELTTPDGRNYFSEGLIPKLLIKKSSSMLKNAVLTVAFGDNEEEFEKFETAYNDFLKERNVLRVDSLAEYMDAVREALKKDATQQRAYMFMCADEVSKAYQKALTEWKEKMENRIFSDTSFSDAGSLLSYRGKLFDSEAGLSENLCEKDKHIFDTYKISYQNGQKKLFEKYCMADIKKLADRLAENKPVQIDYTPKTGTVKGIFERVKLKHYRMAVDVQIKEKLSKRYCSLLCIKSGSEDSIYNLLNKAVSSEYCQIEVYGYEQATHEEQEVIRFLQDSKDVILLDLSVHDIAEGSICHDN